MDLKDLLVLIIVFILVIIIGKLFPNNPINLLGNYIKGLFKDSF